MYEVKWMPKSAAELEELCNKAIEHGFELVACNDKFCVFRAAQPTLAPDLLPAPACCASFVAYGVHHQDCRNNPQAGKE